MRKALLCLTLLGVVLSHRSVSARAIYLTWEWPAAYPLVDGFLITTATAAHDPVETVLPMATAASACQHVPDVTPVTKCLNLACPQEGVMSLWVKATQGHVTGTDSDILTAQVAPDCTVTTLSLVPSDGTVPTTVPDTPIPEAPRDPPPATPDPAAAQHPAPGLTVVTAVDANLVLGWTYPREQETPQRFILGYTSEVLRSPALFAVPIHDVAACSTVPGVDWCARLACPGQGTWSFWVQPDYGTGTPLASDTRTCAITSPALPCTCTPIQAQSPPEAVPLPGSAPATAEPSQDEPPTAPQHPRHHRRHRHAHHR